MEAKTTPGILGRTSQRERPEHIRFDEETIEEHNKTRGTRTKITEPKTPYNYQYDEEEEHEEVEQFQVGHVNINESAEVHEEETSEGGRPKRASFREEEPGVVDMESVANKLNEAEDHHRIGWRDTNSSDEDRPSQEKKDFLKKRRNHYDEFRMVQLLRNQLPDDDDEDDEDDSSSQKSSQSGSSGARDSDNGGSDSDLNKNLISTNSPRHNVQELSLGNESG